MTDAFYDFEWEVAPQYEWQDWLGDNGKPAVVPTSGLMGFDSPDTVELTWRHSGEKKETYGPVLHAYWRHKSELRRYRPMAREHAALFQEFGELDYTSTAAVLEFAHKYGALGVPMPVQLIQRLGIDGKRADHYAHGEPFLDWAMEICFMREGLRLSGKNKWSSEAPRLKWLFDRQLQKVQGRLAFNATGDPMLVLTPLTLLAAMWLQLALAVTREKRFLACKFCRHVFEISTDQTGFRSHREFCSDSCKTMDYRRRKRTALELAASGLDLQYICETTGTETATVRSWLAAKRADRPAKTGRQ